MKIDVFVMKKKKKKKIRFAENAAGMNLRVSINPRLFQIILSSPPPPLPSLVFFPFARWQIVGENNIDM